MIRIFALLILATPVAADIVVPARTLPAQTLIGPEDLLLRDIEIPGGLEDPSLIIGLETRVALFAGRAIRMADVGPPAIVNRNQLITLVYDQGGLVIRTEGRALDRAGSGEVIRVMNMASRSTVSARIGADGAGYVAN